MSNSLMSVVGSLVEEVDLDCTVYISSGSTGSGGGAGGVGVVDSVGESFELALMGGLDGAAVESASGLPVM